MYILSYYCYPLTHSLIHHFETVPNYKKKKKKLQTTTEMWLLKEFKIKVAEKKNMEKGEIAHFEHLHLFPQCFPKAFFLQCVKISTYRLILL